MYIIKKMVKVMVDGVKKSNYNCSLANYYKPKKLLVSKRN